MLKKEIEVPDQWEIQVLTRVMQKAKVYVISKLKENDIGNIGLKYAVSVEEAISNSLKIHGEDARILILPNGPQILPKLRSYCSKLNYVEFHWGKSIYLNLFRSRLIFFLEEYQIN